MTDKGGRMDVDEKIDDEPRDLGFEEQILDTHALDSAIAAAEPRRDIEPIENNIIK
jgi:hypothetical protein